MKDNGSITKLEHIELNNMNHSSKYNQDSTKTKSKCDKSSSSSSNSAHSDVEDLCDYGAGGYYPCHIGELIKNKYLVLKKLGWGHFSTVWLALNLDDKQLYALKI